MKPLKMPSAWVLVAIILPAIICLIFVPLFLNAYPIWAIATGAVSYVAFLAVCTTVYISQKNYKGLIRLYFTTLLWIAIYILQFGGS